MGGPGGGFTAALNAGRHAKEVQLGNASGMKGKALAEDDEDDEEG